MKIYIQGFKSIRDGQFVAIGNRLTFLVGPNSAGKSVVLAALEKLSGDSADFSVDENLIHKNPSEESSVSACHSLGVEWTKGNVKYGQFATHYVNQVSALDNTQLLKNIHTCTLSTKLGPDDWHRLNSTIGLYVKDKLAVGLHTLEGRRDPIFRVLQKTPTIDEDQIFIDFESLNDNDQEVFRNYINWAIEVVAIAQEVIRSRNQTTANLKNISAHEKLAATWRAHLQGGLFCWDYYLIQICIKNAFQGLAKQQKLNILEKYNSKILRYKLDLIEYSKKSYPGKAFKVALVAAERVLPTTNDTACHLTADGSNNIYHELMRAQVNGAWGLRVEPLFDRVNKALSDNLFTDNGYQVQVSSKALVNKELWDERRDVSEEIDVNDCEFLAQLSLVDSHRRDLSFDSVGSGIGYVLPVLIESFRDANTDKIVFLQQPELHLHPALQTNLTDVLIEASLDKRIIAETHSEHMILRALKRIRQTKNGIIQDPLLKLKPSDVAVNYFEPLPDGSTRIHILRISNDGDFLDRWPNGFFEERGQELFDE